MKFSGKVGNGPFNKWLNFDGDPITVWIPGLFFGFVTIGRYRKWFTDMLLILICQMVALVRRALVEVCTVPELLVCATSVPNVVQMFSLYILSTFFAFNALTLLVWHQEEHPACKNGVIRCWHGYLSGVRCNWFAYALADSTATPLSLASLKSRFI